MTTKDQVKKTYDSIGLEFSASRRFLWPEVIPYLEKLPQNAKVLDLGCGNGRLLTAVKKPIRYTGIDFSQTLIAEARRLHPKEIFIEGDITNVSIYKDLGQYDAIFCLAVLHHLEPIDHLTVLQQIIDRLKTGGFALISVWRLWQPKFAQYHLKSLPMKVKNWHCLNIPFQSHPRFHYAFTAKELVNLAQKAGFITNVIARSLRRSNLYRLPRSLSLPRNDKVARVFSHRDNLYLELKH